MTFTAKRRLVYMMMAVPALIYLCLQVIPLAASVVDAFTDVEGAFTFGNFSRVFADPLFQKGALYNLLIPVVSVAMEAIIGVALALWFYYMRGSKTLWRTVAIVPFAVPQIVYLLTMKLVFRQHGYLNSLLFNIAGSGAVVNWFAPGSPLAVLLIMLIDAWRVTPIVFLIVLVALEQIPTDYIEAARVDGASTWNIIRKIQLPLVVPALLVALSLRAVDAFRIFATPYVLTGVQKIPVLTSVAYHYKAEAHNSASANATALTLAVGIFILIALALAIFGRRRSSA